MNYDLLLLNYLKTPIYIDNKPIVISDLIRFYSSEDYYKEELIIQSKKIFDPILENKRYKLKIGNNVLIDTIVEEEKEIITSKTTVPNKESIEVVLEVEAI